MVDCAEGTVRQVLQQPFRGGERVKLSKLTKVFVTHMHGEHPSCVAISCALPVTTLGYVATVLSHRRDNGFPLSARALGWLPIRYFRLHRFGYLS